MSAAPQSGLVSDVVTLLGVAFDSKYEPHFRMATSIIEHTRRTGHCLPQDLLTKGYAAREIDERWHLANAMAAVELRLMKDRSCYVASV